MIFVHDWFLIEINVVIDCPCDWMLCAGCSGMHGDGNSQHLDQSVWLRLFHAAAHCWSNVIRYLHYWPTLQECWRVSTAASAGQLPTQFIEWTALWYPCWDCRHDPFTSQLSYNATKPGNSQSYLMDNPNPCLEQLALRALYCASAITDFLVFLL